jgi:hypothetical protein
MNRHTDTTSHCLCFTFFVEKGMKSIKRCFTNKHIRLKVRIVQMQLGPQHVYQKILLCTRSPRDARLLKINTLCCAVRNAMFTINVAKLNTQH